MAKDPKINPTATKNPGKSNQLDGNGPNVFSDQFYRQTPKPPTKPVQKAAPAPKKKP